MNARTHTPIQQSHRTDQPTGRTGHGSVVGVIAGSMAVGLVTALVLALVVFPGATESVITGSLLLGFGVGWATMAVASQQITSQPQRWAAVPAAAMGVVGLALLVLSPQDPTLAALSWAWPPALMALVVWMFAQMRRDLSGRGRWLLTPILVVLAAATIGATVENVTLQQEQQSYPAPGRLYNVGGHRLHLDCRGQGGPTVVLFNGLGGISIAWSRITDEVSTTTRVCAYDRAGQGWSDEVATPQDGIAAAADLHALLSEAGESGPFVLAGHSIGGTYALTYAAQYPDQVAGMVLLDSSSPEQFTRVSAYPRQYAVMRRGLALLPTLARLGVGHLTASTNLTGDDAATVKAMTSTARAARTGRDELSMIPTLFEQARALTTLSGRPLAVLTTSDSLHGAGWAEAQDELAALSDNHLQREVDSSHAGLIDDPHPAAESARAIDQVVVAVRTGSPLTTP
jgi:pimeloyl-ACP methyl ester carboxylesterase